MLSRRPRLARLAAASDWVFSVFTVVSVALWEKGGKRSSVFQDILTPVFKSTPEKHGKSSRVQTWYFLLLDFLLWFPEVSWDQPSSSAPWLAQIHLQSETSCQKSINHCYTCNNNLSKRWGAVQRRARRVERQLVNFCLRTSFDISRCLEANCIACSWWPSEVCALPRLQQARPSPTLSSSSLAMLRCRTWYSIACSKSLSNVYVFPKL